MKSATDVLYFDTSILVPLFIQERASADVRRILDRLPADELTTSAWTRVEFSSALARDVRSGLLAAPQALQVDKEFESLIEQAFVVITPTVDDYALSKRYIQRHETRLKGGDAFHLAIASNHGARGIYCLDQGMMRAGALLGLPMYSYSPR